MDEKQDTLDIISSPELAYKDYCKIVKGPPEEDDEFKVIYGPSPYSRLKMRLKKLFLLVLIGLAVIGSLAFVIWRFFLS